MNENQKSMAIRYGFNKDTKLHSEKIYSDFN